MTRTGEREICSVSGRLPDNPGELARMNSGNVYRLVENFTFATSVLLGVDILLQLW